MSIRKKLFRFYIFIDYENLITFLLIKEFRKKEVIKLDLLRDFKFKIKYLFIKENKRANTLS